MSTAFLMLLTSLLSPGDLQTQTQIPSGGTSLLGANPMSALVVHGESSRGRLKQEGSGADLSIVAETLSRPEHEWSLQLAAVAQEPVEQGDVVLATFWIQAVKGQPETGEARSLVSFQTDGPDWARSVSKSVQPGRQLTQVHVPFEVRHSRPAGRSMLVFDMGYSPQSFRVSRLQLLNYKKSRKLSDLPMSTTRYPGDEPDAAWRREAQQRIRALRTGPFSVKVLDAQGRPASGATVSVELIRHHFTFGTAVAADHLVGPGRDSDKYRQIFLKHFNSAVLENHMKWPYWETWGRKDGIRAMEWLERNSVPLRGHTILWPGFGNLPPDLRNLTGKPEAMRARIEAHMQDIIGVTKGRLFEWDVVNEPYANRDLMATLGWDQMAFWFRRVKELDPKPRLVLNDYPPLDGFETSNAHLNHFYGQIEALQKAKAPIEAIGFQCHIGGRPIPPANLLKGLDRFSRFGLPIVATEFDIDTPDRDLQARYMRDFMTALFSHPSVDGITQWGFWQGRHWMPNAGLWDVNWNIRPHGQVYLDLIHKEWSTKADLKTGANGRAQVRAFFGTYKVTVKGKDGRVTTVEHRHLPTGKPTELVVRAS